MFKYCSILTYTFGYVLLNRAVQLTSNQPLCRGRSSQVLYVALSVLQTMLNILIFIIINKYIYLFIINIKNLGHRQLSGNA